MLNTTDLTSATDAVTYPRKGTFEQRQEYNASIRELESQWKLWLADEYASELPASIQEKIFTKAWEDGHSSGYTSVEYAYEDIAGFANEVVAAVR